MPNGTGLDNDRQQPFSAGMFIVWIFDAAQQKFNVFTFVYRSQLKTKVAHQLNFTTEHQTLSQIISALVEQSECSHFWCYDYSVEAIYLNHK